MPGPHTDVLAQAVDHFCTLKPELLITVTNANIRLATVSGTFLVCDKYKAGPYIFRGKKVVDVYCCWFDWKPDRGCIRLILNNNESIYFENNPRIECVSNIRRRSYISDNVHKCQNNFFG